MPARGEAEPVLARKIGAGIASRPGNEEDEATLLARVCAGETQSFRALVDRHLPTVLAIARRMLRDDAEAEDVAQETLLRLWRNAAGLELGESGVRPWLRRVAANLCIDRVAHGMEPACVHTCTTKALGFGPIQELAKKKAEKASVKILEGFSTVTLKKG